jgi:hypothetical protein
MILDRLIIILLIIINNYTGHSSHTTQQEMHQKEASKASEEWIHDSQNNGVREFLTVDFRI